jgi:hypothetical protein
MEYVSASVEQEQNRCSSEETKFPDIEERQAEIADDFQH